MAGTLIVSNLTTDTDNTFIVRSNTGTTLFSANTTGIDVANSIGATAITNDKILSVANTKISGLVTASQIANVANTQLTGLVTASQIASVANTQLTGVIQSAQIASGVLKFVAFQTYQNSTRQVTSSSTNYVLFTTTITKTSSSSTWIITGLFPTQNPSTNDGHYMYLEIDGVRDYTGIVKPYIAGTAAATFSLHQIWTGLSSGTKTVKLGWSAIDGSSNQAFGVWNPNSSDDARDRQTGSNITFFEVL
jgi:hypothetical protein